jgi:ATP-dependent protease ClpP protease subunit
MTTIEINGVMVDGYSDDDCPLFEQGLLAPCEEIARDIITTDEDILLKINSYGGSVEGGTRISIALSDWLAFSGHELTVEIEGICASAAANLVARLSPYAKVKAHPESMLMFHSCQGMCEGSPDQLRDSADRMEAYNRVIIASLLKRTSLDRATVEKWFSVGREGWMSGMDAKECGLVDELLNDDFVGAPMLPPSDVEQKGWKYAAIAAIANKHKEMQTMDEEKVIEKEIEVVEPVAEEEKPVVEPVAENPVVEEVVEELKDDEKKEDGIQAEEDELAALRAENEELKKELEALKATCEKLTAGLKTKTETKAVKKTFAELVKEIPTNISDSAYAAKFTALKQSHKAEYDAWMEAHKRR